jgi:hypothetical protein
MVDITSSRVRSVLDYDEATGVFTWRETRGGNAVVGQQAGTMLANGYRHIMVDGRFYLAHRLAWFYVHGRWPPCLMDHIDGNRDCNALANLREANGFENAANSVGKRNSRTGLKGVALEQRTGRFVARIMVRGKQTHLGTFATAEEASAAYLAAARAANGAFAKVA